MLLTDRCASLNFCRCRQRAVCRPWKSTASGCLKAARLPSICANVSARMPGSPDRMAWLVWLHFAETVSQHTAALVQQHVALREDHMRSPVVMKLEAARISRCYDALEARLSTPVENRDYLLTSGFSAVDISVGQAVYMARFFVTLDNHPAVAEWYARITERDTFIASLPQDGSIFDKDFYPPWPIKDVPQS